MDFHRIEWIFLVVFAFLDIFLGWSVTQNQKVYLSTGTTGGNSQIVRDIKQDDITVPKLSNKQVNSSYAASETSTMLSQNYERVAKSGDQNVTINTGAYQTLDARLNRPLRLRKKDVLEQVKSFINNPNNVLFGKNYVYEADMSNGSRYVFVQKLAGVRVIDDRAMLVLTVNDGSITGYTQTYIDKLKMMDNNQKIMSARDAVYTLYRSNEIVNNSRVIWTHLGYTWLLNAKGSTVYVPAWFVGIESKSSKNVTVKRVNAITKAVIKTR